MHCALPKPVGRGALSYPLTRSSPLINPEILSKQPGPPLLAALYKSRWQVELFFKWIKQHLRIRKFYGTSANALKTQIWIAISVYVLVAIVKKQLNLEGSLYRILQILSVSLFEKTPILEALSLSDYEIQLTSAGKQLTLFH
jgi:hypothetical protein